MTDPAGAFNQAINFKIHQTSNNQRYGFFKNSESLMGYTNSALSKSEEVYNFTDVAWIDEAYLTVDFGTTPQTVTDEFYNWFTANAIKQ